MADILRSSRLRDSTPDRRETRILTERELVALQKENLLAALSLSNGRVSGPEGAAQLVGLKPSTFTDRMKKYGIGRTRENRSLTA
jgi:transcriptional regulator with GAF, ATPase, and Fis domain